MNDIGVRVLRMEHSTRSTCMSLFNSLAESRCPTRTCNTSLIPDLCAILLSDPTRILWHSRIVPPNVPNVSFSFQAGIIWPQRWLASQGSMRAIIGLLRFWIGPQAPQRYIT